MPYKNDYVSVIINRISSVSENAFQIECCKILDFYYAQKGLEFEKVGAARGDYKNDGWVRDKSIYYQMFSPVQYSSSFINEVYSKFVEDFSQLSKYVYEELKWSGKIDEFYFLLNTRDVDIPHNENSAVQKTKENIERKYHTTIKIVKIVNKDYLIQLLNELDIEQLETLTSIMGLSGQLDVLASTPENLQVFFGIFANAIIGKQCDELIDSDYAKIPDDNKIKINDLSEKRDRIIALAAHLEVVEEAVNGYINSTETEQKFNSIVELYIKEYNDLSKIYHGSKLYDEIIEKILSYFEDKLNARNNVELMLVYIFDRCDIFEKA